MSRSGYNDDFGDDDPLALGRYRAQVNSAIRGKRGQALLRLNERGGLRPSEMLANIERRKFQRMDENVAAVRIAMKDSPTLARSSSTVPRCARSKTHRRLAIPIQR